MKQRRMIAITSGDADGIGPEVTLKALRQMGPSKRFCYLVYLPKSKRLPTFNKLKATEVTGLKDLPPGFDVYFIQKKSPSFAWVEEVFSFGINRKISALVTGPIAKEAMFSSGFPFLGHTEFFRNKLKNKHLTMVFVGERFNVALASDHISIKDVPSALTPQAVYKTIVQSHLFAERLGLSHLPIGVLGLNPHAGEGGLLGREESLIKKAILMAKRKGIPVVGPLVPDAAFLKPNWNKFSFYVALYHDQGLIPFKVIHGQDSGVQLTLGLPFIRTSVDHGTAKELFGKNLANPNSMVEAIKLAQKLVR